MPDPRLAKTPGGSRTLAAAIGANDSWIPLSESPAGLPVAYGVQQPRLGAEMQIGSEIVRYVLRVPLQNNAISNLQSTRGIINLLKSSQMQRNHYFPVAF